MRALARPILGLCHLALSDQRPSHLSATLAGGSCATTLEQSSPIDLSSVARLRLRFRVKGEARR